jgi:hypothetical protein
VLTFGVFKSEENDSAYADEGLEGLTLMLFTSALKWTPDQVQHTISGLYFDFHCLTWVRNPPFFRRTLTMPRKIDA